jgi:RNA methyltransferase, TrmH family
MPPMIASPHNPRVQQALRLRDAKGRRRQTRIIVDGWRETCRALEAGLEPVELFVCPSLLSGARWTRLRALLEPWSCEPSQVTEQVFAKLAFGDRAEGVVLVAREPRTDLDTLDLPDAPLIAVLQGVEKPGNLGALVRSADAAGVAAVISADAATDLFNPNAIRASLGALFHVPVCAAPSPEVLAWLQSRGANIFAARVDAARDYTQVDYRGTCALVLGSEAQGLSGVWLERPVEPIRLPMRGVVDSLNVSAAAAVLFYEALRQRTAASRG